MEIEFRSNTATAVERARGAAKAWRRAARERGRVSSSAEGKERDEDGGREERE